MAKPLRPATEKQVQFIQRLLKEGRDVWAIDGKLAERAFDLSGNSGKFVSTKEASAVIDALLRLPVPHLTPDPAKTLDEGMYRMPDGVVFKVQRTKDGERLYALRLRQIGGDRLSENGETVHFDFQYEAGAIRNLTSEMRMTLDEAKQFGVLHGICCVCGTRLVDADSVKNGIGPVCAKKVRWR